MALTRPTFQNLNSNLTTFSDALTVTNYGNVANRDIGEVFDRSQGGGSNVAIFWNESTASFRLAYTSSTGKETGNLTVTSNADLIVGNITANNITVTNVVYQNTEYISSTEVVAGNSTVNGLTVNTSATIGTTLGVIGNVVVGNLTTGTGTGGSITGANLISANYFSGNGYSITSINAANVSGAISSAGTATFVTGAAQANITSVGTLTSLTLSGTMIGTAINAGTFGNNGANFTGNVFTMGVATVSGNATVGNILATNFLYPNGVAFTGAGLVYTAANAPPTTGNTIGSQWYNTSTDILYEYQSDGTSTYWVDINGPAYGNSSNDALSPFLLMGA